MSIINIEHLKKNYGKHIGVKDVTFSVNEGEIFGFVGPNGAGKSTTIKVLTGFIFSDGGTATVCGLDTARDSKQIKEFTGYVPSDVRIYENMRVRELLLRNASFYQTDCSKEARRLCEVFEVDVNKRFRELSGGNKKKVSLICALMFGPKVIILDEPTNGLDPVMQKKLFDDLKERTAGGATVFLSSHNLSQVQEYCSRVAFIKGGKILAVSDLSENVPQKIVTAAGGGDAPEDFLLISEEGNKRVFRTKAGAGELITALKKLNPTDFTVENESMEERFWSLYGEGEQK